MLNRKDQIFIDHYIETGNASAAYKKAGFAFANRNSLDAGASKKLRSVKIERAIQERLEAIKKSSAIRIENKRVLLWKVAQDAAGVGLQVNSGNQEENQEGRTIEIDYRASVAAINELNKMDGDHATPKSQVKNERPIFDAEILPPEDMEEIEDIEYIQLENAPI